RDRQGAINPPAGIVVTVVKAPRSGGCPARIRAGQTFAFADTVPAGFCVHACASVIDVVLSLRTVGEQGGVQADAITMTCQQPECGAVFQVTPARSGGSLGVGRRR
ncbi:MAG: TIGR04076 family protein, partial [Planctomycetes bacterium]|nr:TIGR04076 family protein [Planctomycetota bacterium]